MPGHKAQSCDQDGIKEVCAVVRGLVMRLRRQDGFVPSAGRGHTVKKARSLRTGRGAWSCRQEGKDEVPADVRPVLEIDRAQPSPEEAERAQQKGDGVK